MAGHHQWFTIKSLKGLLDSKRGISSGALAEKIGPASHAGDDPRASAFARRHYPEMAETRSAARVLRMIVQSENGGGLIGARTMFSERSAREARIAV